MKPRTETVFIPDIGESLNSILFTQKSWAIYNSLKNRLGKACLAAGMSRVAAFERPVNLEFAPLLGPKRRKFDTSNFIVSAKIIEDWLVKYEVLRGDSAEYVHDIRLCVPVRANDGVEGIRVRIVELDLPEIPEQSSLELAEDLF